ncbi:tRNA (N(6)-L-threonylcarbamoyladenosine(37)-C(2))-methylthiotransferase MtaB [Balneolales bacterium ANBcel1]|nr:tRNA (N(6)-L-threonylcarbamoyladenosine(37)-C(2))-methylthiotransferase MtaB [Balneolales bacterium ANBcel1]
MSTRSVAFHTLGCKLNFAETSTLKRQFSGGAFEIASFQSKADVYVVNTCSVTSDANRDCRKAVRQARRRNPEAFIVVTGCYAQLEPDEIAAIDGVDLVVGARDKFDIMELAGNFEKPDETIIHRTDVNEAADFHHAFSSNDRTRAFLKVQDGCDYKCSFCTIPLARGKSRSPSVAQVVQQARSVIADGYREIVLTGVNVGDFGRYGTESFLDLLKALDPLPGLERIRISSIEPNLLTDDIILFAADSRTVQPHFHIPLQSGSDTMLDLMKRRYRTGNYRSRVETILRHMPDACIGVDVITGHPGETDSLFDETFRFIDALDVGYLHVFTYSERPNTHALDLDGSVAKEVRKARTHKLRRLSDKKRFDFDHRNLGMVRPVLFEQEVSEGSIFGWSDNYIRVAVPYDNALVNRIVYCRLDGRPPSGAVTAVVTSTDRAAV